MFGIAWTDRGSLGVPTSNDDHTFVPVWTKIVQVLQKEDIDTENGSTWVCGREWGDRGGGAVRWVNYCVSRAIGLINGQLLKASPPLFDCPGHYHRTLNACSLMYVTEYIQYSLARN
jgi:hypothetical protein